MGNNPAVKTKTIIWKRGLEKGYFLMGNKKKKRNVKIKNKLITKNQEKNIMSKDNTEKIMDTNIRLENYDNIISRIDDLRKKSEIRIIENTPVDEMTSGYYEPTTRDEVVNAIVRDWFEVYQHNPDGIERLLEEITGIEKQDKYDAINQVMTNNQGE